MRKICLLLFAAFVSMSASGQSRAYVLLNAWDNQLTKFNPTIYLDGLFKSVQTKLVVQEILHDAPSLTDTANKENLERWVQTRINKIERVGTNDYFLAVGTQLKLPLINISRFIFKNAVQTSRLVLYLHVFNSKGESVLSDTMVSHGCVQNKASDNKSSRNFYDNYQLFQQDMQCHLEFIRQRLKEVSVKK